MIREESLVGPILNGDVRTSCHLYSGERYAKRVEGKALLRRINPPEADKSSTITADKNQDKP